MTNSNCRNGCPPQGKVVHLGWLGHIILLRNHQWTELEVTRHVCVKVGGILAHTQLYQAEQGHFFSASSPHSLIKITDWLLCADSPFALKKGVIRIKSAGATWGAWEVKLYHLPSPRYGNGLTAGLFWWEDCRIMWSLSWVRKKSAGPAETGSWVSLGPGSPMVAGSHLILELQDPLESLVTSVVGHVLCWGSSSSQLALSQFRDLINSSVSQVLRKQF